MFYFEIIMILQNDKNHLILKLSLIEFRYNVLFKPNTGVLFDFDASDDEVVLKVSVAGHNYSSLFYNELYSPIIRIKLYSGPVKLTNIDRTGHFGS